MANGKNKGNSFERDFAKQLSLWWSNGYRDDIFWRTSNSGGRATVRGQRGKQTHKQYGDICAIDPIGEPFLDHFTVELKRGYNRHTIADLLDKPKGAAKQQYEKWIEGIIANSKASKSNYWMLVVKRDRRETMVFVPNDVMGIVRFIPIPCCQLLLPAKNKHDNLMVHAMPLAAFLATLDRGLIKRGNHVGSEDHRVDE